MMEKQHNRGLQYYYIEQGDNFAVSSMESAEMSINYVKTHLLDQL